MKRAYLALALLALAALAHAQSGNPEYQPFEGARMFTTQGYQELKLSDARWYVAYQGSQDTAPAWIALAWAARSAQLCASAGAKAFVELRYPFEAVTKQDVAQNHETSDRTPYMQRTAAAPVYIPIYTPSGPRAIPPVLGPSKLAAVRCLSDSDVPTDPARAVSIKEALERAAQGGISTAR